MTHACFRDAAGGRRWVPLGRIRRTRVPTCAVALGALAFGGAYPWAYWPLAAACTVSGSFGFFVARAARLKVADWSMRIALSALAAAILRSADPAPSRYRVGVQSADDRRRAPAGSFLCWPSGAAPSDLGVAEGHDRGVCALRIPGAAARRHGAAVAR